MHNPLSVLQSPAVPRGARWPWRVDPDFKTLWRLNSLDGDPQVAQSLRFRLV